MAALDFPVSPANNQVYTLNGVQYYYNGDIGAWLTNLITNPVNANTTNTQILFNDAGYTNGSIGLVFNKYSNTFSTGNISVTGVISSNGMVGIGTTTPTTNLTIVADNTANRGQLSIQPRSANNTAQISFYDFNNVRSATISQSYSDASWTFGNFRPSSTVFLNNSVESMRITSNGNVGIGNTAPTLKLEVAGNMSVDAFIEYSSVIATSYTITSGRNAMSAGPITLNTGVSVTVPANSVWTIV
jgi:hypothetical protein